MFEKHLGDILQAAVAGVGGIIAALLRKETHGWGETMIAGAGAMFLGFIVAKMCRLAGWNDDTSIILTALSGWIGAEKTTIYIRSIVEKRLGIKVSESEEGGTKR